MVRLPEVITGLRGVGSVQPFHAPLSGCVLPTNPLAPGCRTKRSTRGLCPFSPPSCHAGGVFGNWPRVRAFCVPGENVSRRKPHPEEVPACLRPAVLVIHHGTVIVAETGKKFPV